MNTNYIKEDKLLMVEITEFDFSRVSFMDSAGIGMIIGRYKMMKLIGGSLEIVNISKNVRKILEMSGINKIIQMENKREVS